MAQAIKDPAAEVVAGDCHLANGAIARRPAASPCTRLQLLARAYGMAPEAGERTTDGEGP